MTIDFSQKLTTIAGQPLLQPESTIPLTLAIISVNALLTQYENEQPTPDDKVRRWRLAQKLHGAGETSVTAEDVVLIKKLIGLGFGPLVVGQAFEMLDSSS